MKSRVIADHQTLQLTLDFEPGLTERYKSLRECAATGIYRRGLSSVAIDLDKAPGNLSVELSGDQARHFSVDSLERYIEKSGDVTPIYYLIEKFLQNSSIERDAAAAEVVDMLKAMMPRLKKAGLV